MRVDQVRQRYGAARARSKLTGVKGWVERRIAARPDLATDELPAESRSEHGLKGHRSSVGRLLLRLGLSHRKDRQALEQKRKDVANLRHVWIKTRQPFMASHLERLVAGRCWQPWRWGEAPRTWSACAAARGWHRTLTRALSKDRHGPGTSRRAPSKHGSQPDHESGATSGCSATDVATRWLRANCGACTLLISC